MHGSTTKLASGAAPSSLPSSSSSSSSSSPLSPVSLSSSRFSPSTSAVQVRAPDAGMEMVALRRELQEARAQLSEVGSLLIDEYLVSNRVAVS
jgi:hypothetical protein